ncbi:acyltransferase domain-containing protein [Nonomuraea sp. MTCD27]|uniref:acyltransferase domain-containing protein n=1 Tax=Nonomuraea sp. MTCD27 TaxID=1676747 RepID=UPI0035BF1CF6
MAFLDIDALVGLFPGQGGYRKGALASFWDEGDPVLRGVLAEIDEVALRVLGTDIGSQIFGPAAAIPEGPELFQLAVYTVSVATYELLRVREVEFGLLVGHSMGEFAALVAGGALTVAQGAEMLCHRIAATAGTSGGMLSLSCDVRRVEQILDLAAEPHVVVAVVNGRSQVVVSGPEQGLARIGAVADALGLPAVRLPAPAPFHNDLMSGVRTEVVKRLGRVRCAPTRTPVYSPILGRCYRDDDDLVDILGMHLVTPVRFDTTIARLHEAGARVFMEVGAGRTLTGLVKAAHPQVVILPALTEPAAVDTEDTDEPVDVPSPQPSTTDEEVMAQLRAIYAAALDYPEDVLTADAHLEAELGVDSVKRIQLLGRVGRHFGLEPSAVNGIADHETLGDIAGQVIASLEASGGR